MSKKEKLLKKCTDSPPKSDLTYDELKTLLESPGYEKIEGSGSRVKFFNQSIRDVVVLHKPHPGNILNKATLRDIREKLEKFLEKYEATA